MFDVVYLEGVTALVLSHEGAESGPLQVVLRDDCLPQSACRGLGNNINNRMSRAFQSPESWPPGRFMIPICKATITCDAD